MAMLQSVCGPTGFAEAVRHNSGHDYPWHSLDAAELQAVAALAARPASADTRIVTVAQLEDWIGVMEDWDEGHAAQKIDDIRAIIGDTK